MDKNEWKSIASTALQNQWIPDIAKPTDKKSLNYTP